MLAEFLLFALFYGQSLEADLKRLHQQHVSRSVEGMPLL
jgi:hypothetical protein